MWDAAPFAANVHRTGLGLALTCPFGVMLLTWVQRHKHVSHVDVVLAFGRVKT